MESNRVAGILLHPTSLPGRYGMGEIGPVAWDFVNKLKKMGQHIWQVLPLGPTGYGDSPYQSLSTFAGNPLLISLELLVKDDLLSASRLKGFPRFPEDHVDYGPVIQARLEVLDTVCRTFNRRASDSRKKAFEKFCKANAYWLDDYALFVAIKDSYGGKPWIKWKKGLVRREEKALAEARKKFKTAIRNIKIKQYLFDDQWTRLRKKCRQKGIRIIGDIPIFVAHDSADVWAHPELYYLDDDGNTTVVAGVPPDYFSETGQLWGNPLYRWDLHRETGYAWWMSRMKRMREMFDIIRIDHFRGFEAYWEIPGNAKNAIHGRWVPGPAEDFFERLREELGDVAIIAEDLGIITQPVEDLRDRFGLPGMRVLHFAFGNDPKADDYRPEAYPRNCVVYTGTHDNDTTVGWFNSAAGGGSTRSHQEIEEERRAILDYLGTDGSEIHWDLISLALHSNADTVIVPLQDVLGLGSDARMNVPGRESGNWRWRFRGDQLANGAVSRLRELTDASHRS